MKSLQTNRIIPIIFCLSVFINYTAMAGDAPPQATSPELEAIKKVAVVNGEPILQTDFDAEFNQIKKRFIQKGQDVPQAQLDKAKTDILESLIDQELLHQESIKRGIAVDDAEVSDGLARIKQQYPSETEFNNMLTEMNWSSKDVSERIKRSLAVNKMVEKDLVPKITVTDDETKAFYDGNRSYFSQPNQVKASHILVKVDSQGDDTQKETAKKKIESIQEKLKNGEDFAELAINNSDCPSGSRGGDLGFFGPGSMVKPFEEAAFSLNPGDVSDIVETQFGYHIIKVTDKKEAKEISYPEAKANIENYLKRKKTQEEVKSLISALKKDAKIERSL